jgi:ATP-dependent Clp protease ATP-binding subunit ClpC
MKRMLRRIEDLGYRINITDKAKEFLAEKGFDADFGARPLQRALQKFLEEPLAERVLQGALKEGDELIVDYVDGNEGLTLMESVAAPKAKTKKLSAKDSKQTDS